MRCFSRKKKQRLGAQGRPPAHSWHSLCPDLQVVVAGVAHLAETGDEEVVAAVVGGGVLLDVGKLHELGGKKQRVSTEKTTKRVSKRLSRPANTPQTPAALRRTLLGQLARAQGHKTAAPRMSPGRNVSLHGPTGLQQRSGLALGAVSLTVSPAVPAEGCKSSKAPS